MLSNLFTSTRVVNTRLSRKTMFSRYSIPLLALTGAIAVSSEKKNGQTIGSVQDTGTGIDREIMPRLLQICDKV